MDRTLGEIAAHVGGTLEGDPSVRVRGVAGLREAGPDEVTFLANGKYGALLGGIVEHHRSLGSLGHGVGAEARKAHNDARAKIRGRDISVERVGPLFRRRVEEM